jgi:4-cresol dehydrogenase (hydroxylating)
MSDGSERALAIAGKRWAAAIGEDRVTIATEIGLEWSRSTIPWPARPLTIVTPGNPDEVVACLRIANETGTPLHAVSRGRSWGLGSRLPPRDAVILDLSRLDRILDLDIARGTARIEPGVTFAALQAALDAEGLSYHLPGFGGPVDASVLANALERGEGAGSAGDRYAELWDLDIALATGERFRTGFARYDAPDISAYHARPAGPLLEGLFSQSGFGVVLSGRIGLQPTLPFAASLIAEIGEPGALGPAVEVLRRLVSARLIDPHSLAIWNGAKRRASLVGRHDVAPDIWRKMTSDDWALSLIIASPHRELFDLNTRLVTQELQPVTHDIHVGSDRDAAGVRLKTPLTGFSDGLNVLSAYSGKPRRPAVPGNPDLDGCGFLWLCPVVEFTGEAVAQLAAVVREATDNTALMPALGLQAVSARALHGYISLAWDRNDAAVDETAPAIHDDLVDRLIDAGMPPYRLGLPTIDRLPHARDAWNAALGRIRSALDPNGILSPGRVAGLG